MTTYPLNWFVARVATRAEFQAAAEIAEAGGQTVCPVHRVSVLRRHTKSVRRIETRALLTGYLFVQARDTDTLRAAKAFRGLLMNAGRPVVVPASAVDALMRECAAGTFDIGIRKPVVPGKTWKAGEPVKVTSGPLAGLVLHVEGGRAKRGHVRLILAMAGRPSSFTIPETMLEAA
jgi:transcription antitermination factor NusG